MSKRPVRPAPRIETPASDRWPGYATVPLRFFLGATFVYAGLQKIADPGFLLPGSTTYIGTQLQAFATHSPIGVLVGVFAEPTPQLTGVAVIVTELAVGGLVVLGIATGWAGVAGALVNFVFFLTASWTVQPYFLGSDSIYTVAWITLALVGDQGLLTARPLLFGRPDATTQRSQPADQSRRRLLLQIGSAAVATVWALSVLPRPRAAALTIQPEPTPSASPTPVASPTGTKVGTTADLQAHGFLNFQDPTTGDPAVAVSLSGGRVAAYDAICTHAGCTVAYDSNQKLLACPCHGALFDPAHAGAVVEGPAPTPLPAIRIEVAADGALYAG